MPDVYTTGPYTISVQPRDATNDSFTVSRGQEVHTFDADARLDRWWVASEMIQRTWGASPVRPDGIPESCVPGSDGFLLCMEHLGRQMAGNSARIAELQSAMIPPLP